MFNKISIYLLSFLPISLILGNFAINLNILLINFLILYHCYKNNNWSWIKESTFKLLIFFNLYLIINSIILSYLMDYPDYSGLVRSLTFFKFILLAYSFKLLIISPKSLNKVMKIWCLIICVVIFDVFFERILGYNILGYVSPDHTRIVSFFKDEAVVGGLILCFGFIVTTYFLNKNLKFKAKLFFNSLLFFIPVTIFISGERSNFIKSIIIFFVILFLINKIKLLIGKKTTIILLILSIITGLITNESIYIKQKLLFNRILIVEDPQKFSDRFQNISYFAHYDVALKIFKDFPFSGVGNKNFRHQCSREKYFDINIKFSTHRCNTHPHQVHFELLSEHGLIGYTFLFYVILLFIRNNLKRAKLSKNIFNYSSNIYLIIFLIPLLPSGAFFSTFNGTLFWIVFSVASINFNKEKY